MTLILYFNGAVRLIEDGKQHYNIKYILEMVRDNEQPEQPRIVG
jgi:hypothetical protein